MITLTIYEEASGDVSICANDFCVAIISQLEGDDHTLSLARSTYKFEAGPDSRFEKGIDLLHEHLKNEIDAMALTPVLDGDSIVLEIKFSFLDDVVTGAVHLNDNDKIEVWYGDVGYFGSIGIGCICLQVGQVTRKTPVRDLIRDGLLESMDTAMKKLKESYV